ncbi:MAG: RES domain-containing protein, partial [Alphaproteobacteria bacterium]
MVRQVSGGRIVDGRIRLQRGGSGQAERRIFVRHNPETRYGRKHRVLHRGHIAQRPKVLPHSSKGTAGLSLLSRDLQRELPRLTRQREPPPRRHAGAFFAEDQTYVPIRLDGWRHGALWRRFREAILHRQRFFNDNAKEFLAEIFNGIQNQSDIDNKPAFYRLAPADDTTFYRARVVPNEDAFREIAKDTAGLMGPPPPSLRKAGRMNAAGIAVFYGATEKDTAVAEMRPAVDSLISLAAFRVHRPINVLDLTRFTRAGKQLDIFAKNQMVRATQWAFMQSFASEISQPILPGDEHLEYVPAQVVAEYLTSTSVRWRGNDVTPDAIIFRSAQREGGKNIAVMGDAALIHHPT